MDVKATYLNADLDKEIYMEVPPSFDIPDGHILRLKKGVYGMKQGGRVWYINFSRMLVLPPAPGSSWTDWSHVWGREAHLRRVLEKLNLEYSRYSDD